MSLSGAEELVPFPIAEAIVNAESVNVTRPATVHVPAGELGVGVCTQVNNRRDKICHIASRAVVDFGVISTVMGTC